MRRDSEDSYLGESIQDELSVEVDETSEVARADEDQLQYVLRLQSADGWFGWDDSVDALFDDIGPHAKQLRHRVELALPSKLDAVTRERVRHTALVLLLLPAKFAGDEGMWRRAYRKASRHFLTTALGRKANEVEEWLDSLRRPSAPRP